MDQEKVWDEISEKWNEFKTKQSPSIKNFLKNKHGRILDLGCGSGRNFKSISKNSEIYAIDFSKKMLKYAKENAEKLKLNFKLIHSTSDKISFKDNFFDSSICIALLHCIPEKQKRQNTINEIYRTLKPKSHALISVWGREKNPRLKNKPKECFIPWTINEQKQERFTYVYDLEELKNEVIKAGFKIIKIWEERNINIIAEK